MECCSCCVAVLCAVGCFDGETVSDINWMNDDEQRDAVALAVAVLV